MPWSYLVVDDHVDSAVGSVGWQVAEVEGLVHDTLASKGSIPVQEDGHHLQRKPKLQHILTNT
jgi:hypothetical protein